MVVTVIRMTLYGVRTVVFSLIRQKLPVKQLRFGDVSGGEEGYHTLGKLICFGIA